MSNDDEFGRGYLAMLQERDYPMPEVEPAVDTAALGGLPDDVDGILGVLSMLVAQRLGITEEEVRQPLEALRGR